MILHGLKSCDTCRKAQKALQAAGHGVAFRDVRAEPLSAPEIARFLAALGAPLINRSSTTWRALPEAEKALPEPELLARHPTLMKRPVIEAEGRLHLGWGKQTRAALLE